VQAAAYTTTGARPPCARIQLLVAPPTVPTRTPGHWSRSPSTVRRLRLGLESAAAERPTGYNFNKRSQRKENEEKRHLLVGQEAELHATSITGTPCRLCRRDAALPPLHGRHSASIAWMPLTTLATTTRAGGGGVGDGGAREIASRSRVWAIAGKRAHLPVPKSTRPWQRCGGGQGAGFQARSGVRGREGRVIDGA
jgi:hypothetical protein